MKGKKSTWGIWMGRIAGVLAIGIIRSFFKDESGNIISDEGQRILKDPVKMDKVKKALEKSKMEGLNEVSVNLN